MRLLFLIAAALLIACVVIDERSTTPSERDRAAPYGVAGAFATFAGVVMFIVERHA